MLTNQQLSYNLFSSFFIHKKAPSVNDNKFLWKMHWKPWQKRITDKAEIKTRESYSIWSLLLVSSSQHKSFEFIIQLLVIISNLIIIITMLLMCIQSLHERPSFGIAHYTVIRIMNLFKTWQLKASTLTLYSRLRLISQTFYKLLIEIMWHSMICQKLTFLERRCLYC